METNMGLYSNFFDDYMSELDKKIPKTVEEAEDMIKKDEVQFATVVTAANIAALSQILINKGIMTEEEFKTWYNACEQICLKAAAKKVMQILENDD